LKDHSLYFFPRRVTFSEFPNPALLHFKKFLGQQRRNSDGGTCACPATASQEQQQRKNFLRDIGKSSSVLSSSLTGREGRWKTNKFSAAGVTFYEDVRTPPSSPAATTSTSLFDKMKKFHSLCAPSAVEEAETSTTTNKHLDEKSPLSTLSKGATKNSFKGLSVDVVSSSAAGTVGGGADPGPPGPSPSTKTYGWSFVDEAKKVSEFVGNNRSGVFFLDSFIKAEDRLPHIFYQQQKKSTMS
jgi:hypothetical protein